MRPFLRYHTTTQPGVEQFGFMEAYDPYDGIGYGATDFA